MGGSPWQWEAAEGRETLVRWRGQPALPTTRFNVPVSRLLSHVLEDAPGTLPPLEVQSNIYSGHCWTLVDAACKAGHFFVINKN